MSEIIKQLEELGKLFTEGKISVEEFEARKMLVEKSIPDDSKNKGWFEKHLNNLLRHNAELVLKSITESFPLEKKNEANKKLKELSNLYHNDIISNKEWKYYAKKLCQETGWDMHISAIYANNSRMEASQSLTIELFLLDLKKKKVKTIYPTPLEDIISLFKEFINSRENFKPRTKREKRVYQDYINKIKNWRKPIDKRGILIDDQLEVKVTKKGNLYKAEDLNGKNLSSLIKSSIRKNAFNTNRNLKAVINMRSLRWAFMNKDTNDLNESQNKSLKKYDLAIGKRKILNGMAEEMVLKAKGKPLYFEKETIIDDKSSNLTAKIKRFYFGKPFNYEVVIKNKIVVQHKKLRLGVWEQMPKKALYISFGKPYKERESSFKGEKTHTCLFNSQFSKREAIEVILENDIVVGYSELGYKP